MKIIGYFFVLFIFVSCNIKNEEAVEAPVVAVTEGSINKDLGKISQEDTTSSNSNVNKKAKLILIGRGSEPGWYAEFFEDHLRLLIDNGTDSLILSAAFHEIVFRENFSMTHSESIKNKKPVNLAVSVENKACTEEASGEKREKSITVKYNGKTYKGCATLK